MTKCWYIDCEETPQFRVSSDYVSTEHHVCSIHIAECLRSVFSRYRSKLVRVYQVK